ncbi:pyridoxamine 5'-phosphate oxidase family protein [Cryptosporangium sp. NPDC051539]|uniref:pyridoxamine 5'-phosphate oxidase family protein n=1 Tax=Cryptosporangium sp. NPDC051539 TaxID=3363962 RepID=UPI0037B8DBA7
MNVWALGEHLPDLLVVPGQRMVVATTMPDGQPHLTVVWYGFVDDGRIAFTVRSQSVKARNLARDPRLTVLVDTGTTHGELRGVQIAGRAVLDNSPATKRLVHESVAGRYSTKATADVDRTMAKRLAVLVEPITIRSWDHRR